MLQTFAPGFSRDRTAGVVGLIANDGQHGAGAGYYLQYADRSEVGEGEIAQLDLMEEIEQRVQDRKSKTATQPFDPRNDMGTDLTTLYEEEAKGLKMRNKVPFHPIPLVVYQPVTSK